MINKCSHYSGKKRVNLYYIFFVVEPGAVSPSPRRCGGYRGTSFLHLQGLALLSVATALTELTECPRPLRSPVNNCGW